MKNQYFGDVNDYRKYGLLRALVPSGDLSLAVAWMLTPDDGGTDGSFRRYLSEPTTWRPYDPPLFDHLASALEASSPAVGLMEQSDLLPQAHYFRRTVPDDEQARLEWGAALVRECGGRDVVFLDPDNGLEVTSKPIGRKGSSKYVAWREVEALWESGSSVLIYQHFCREPRQEFTERMRRELRSWTSAPLTEAFATPHVLFLLAAQPRHVECFQRAIAGRLGVWSDQIEVVTPSLHAVTGTDGVAVESETGPEPVAVGRLVKHYIADIFHYCETVDHGEIDRLLDHEYGRKTFRLSFPFCKPVSEIGPDESNRYWRDVYLVRGRQVRVTSQWIEGQHRLRFLSYLVEKALLPAATVGEYELSAIRALDEKAHRRSAVATRVSTRVNARYRSHAIGNAQNSFIRNILSNLGEESFSEKDWQATKEHFEHRCAYCGEGGDLLIEHAIPINRERLGEHRLGNIVPSCRKCNADKGGRDFRDFLGENAEAISHIEEYMDSRNYVALEDSDQMKMILNMAHAEVAALADRYVTLINSLFGDAPESVEPVDATNQEPAEKAAG